MRNHINLRRRHLILGALSSSILIATGCTTTPKKEPPTPKPISVDVSNVKDVPSLIAAIKKAGKNVIPRDLADEVFYKEFAEKFIANARAAIDRGFKIPDWIVEKLPGQRKVGLVGWGLVAFTFGGAMFVLPIEIIFIAVLGSIFVMSSALSTALEDENKKYKPRI